MNPSDPQGDLLQTTPAAASSSAVENLQRQYHALNTLFVIALVSLVLLGFGVIFFIYKQMSNVSAQLESATPEASKIVAEFQKNGEPLVRNFVGSLQMFATTNRDFLPVLEKYRPLLSPYFAPPVGLTPSLQPVLIAPPKISPK